MYDVLIAQAIGTTDPATVVLVEELMRLSENGPLDHLEPALFELGAREALDDAKLMAQYGGLETFCRAHQIEVPEL